MNRPSQGLGFSYNCRVHSHLIRYPEAKLYYWLRSQDRQGQGWLRIDWLDIPWPKSTVYRWLKEGKARGFYRTYFTSKDGWSLYVYYCAKAKVAAALGLSTWGAVAEIDFNLFSKFLATELEIYRLQERAFHAARKQYGNSVKRINSQTWERATKPRRYYVNYSKRVYGTSQESVAKSLGLSVRSINRHYRRQRMCVRQIAQLCDKSEYQEARFEESEWNQNQTGRYVVQGRRVFKLKVNHYRCDIPLMSERTQRENYKHSLSVSKKQRGQC